jgi:hypothetical protein
MGWRFGYNRGESAEFDMVQIVRSYSPDPATPAPMRFMVYVSPKDRKSVLGYVEPYGIIHGKYLYVASDAVRRSRGRGLCSCGRTGRERWRADALD